MDKSLKKLSRLELLEVMVHLSEERDTLVAENDRLRQALAAKPSISRAAKIGSIAELALQSNGYFESVQRSADDYLREIKRMRDQLAARLAAEGQASVAAAQVPSVPVQQVNSEAVQDAQAKARAIVKRANSQAESIIADARTKSDEVIADANRQSRAIIARANRQADAVISAAHNDANRSRQRAVNPGLSAPIRGRHVRAAEGA